MAPGLNLNNLKYFYDAVEAKSLSEAARRNFITQSAVSQGIQKLEKALGFSLITHQRNCFKVTPEGVRIFLLSQQIFRALKAMHDLAHEHMDVMSGDVHIVCTQSIAMNLIAAVLQTLKLKYPQISLNMKIMKMEHIPSLLKRGLTDLGIVVASEVCDQFESQIIRKGFFRLYGKKNAVGDIQGGVYVDHLSGLYVDRLQVNYKRKFNKELAILQELDSWQVLAKCSENGIGWCFLPDFTVAATDDIIASTEVPSVPYSIVAIYPKGVHLSKAAKAFLSLL